MTRFLHTVSQRIFRVTSKIDFWLREARHHMANSDEKSNCGCRIPINSKYEKKKRKKRQFSENFSSQEKWTLHAKQKLKNLHKTVDASNKMQNLLAEKSRFISSRDVPFCHENRSSSECVVKRFSFLFSIYFYRYSQIMSFDLNISDLLSVAEREQN